MPRSQMCGPCGSQSRGLLEAYQLRPSEIVVAAIKSPSADAHWERPAMDIVTRHGRVHSETSCFASLGVRP